MDILWPQMVAMAVLGVTLLTISVLRFHKALDQARSASAVHTESSSASFCGVCLLLHGSPLPHREHVVWPCPEHI